MVSSEDEIIEDSGKDFANKGLNTTKNIKNYDCWDEEITPAEWI